MAVERRAGRGAIPPVPDNADNEATPIGRVVTGYWKKLTIPASGS